MEQVWFPGVHSNVGGSYPDAHLSDLALTWMIQRVSAKTKLAFDKDYLTDRDRVAPNPMGKIYESRTGLYAVSRVYPYQRLIGSHVVPGSWLRKYVKRKNDDGPYANEMIHHSAIERFGKMAEGPKGVEEYRPENLASAIGKLQEVDGDGNIKPAGTSRHSR